MRQAARSAESTSLTTLTRVRVRQYRTRRPENSAATRHLLMDRAYGRSLLGLRFGVSRPSNLSVGGVTVSLMTTRIDCDTCIVRGLACHDCVVTVLLGPPPELTFDDEERRALDVLAAGGLVPPLRMVQPVDGPDVESA